MLHVTHGSLRGQLWFCSMAHCHSRTQLKMQVLYGISHSGAERKKQESCWKQRMALKASTETWHMWSTCQGQASHMTKPNVNGAETYTPPTGCTENPMAVNGDVYFSCRKEEWRAGNQNVIYHTFLILAFKTHRKASFVSLHIPSFACALVSCPLDTTLSHFHVSFLSWKCNSLHFLPTEVALSL